MYFLYNFVSFFRNIYSAIFKKSHDTDIQFFLKNLSNNWNSLNPNDPIYYDILNLYIKYSKETQQSLGFDINKQNIKEYRLILDNLNLNERPVNSSENENDNSVVYNSTDTDINEHMKYYITGWYLLNMSKENQPNI